MTVLIASKSTFFARLPCPAFPLLTPGACSGPIGRSVRQSGRVSWLRYALGKQCVLHNWCRQPLPFKWLRFDLCISAVSFVRTALQQAVPWQHVSWCRRSRRLDSGLQAVDVRRRTLFSCSQARVFSQALRKGCCNNRYSLLCVCCRHGIALKLYWQTVHCLARSGGHSRGCSNAFERAGRAAAEAEVLSLYHFARTQAPWTCRMLGPGLRSDVDRAELPSRDTLEEVSMR